MIQTLIVLSIYYTLLCYEKQYCTSNNFAKCKTISTDIVCIHKTLDIKNTITVKVQRYV